ncbi:hypothetical protein HanXRQr2_Chr11g0467891 [Helianthus annuus]|uniref:BAH domain-containing protein n=1 Tax=Helianthus annuus TaxID=4232 RepID=A0A251T7B2_HELAN|nr:hypothetical protein HanXRQr2_Chr11g0467891 [Helianthus annuus]KAJ0873342.1 hypothetical protein HanPSC8_Chr11g0451521 [Helianthus annuus]
MVTALSFLVDAIWPPYIAKSSVSGCCRTIVGCSEDFGRQLEASTNQELNQRIPHFNLKSKILCTKKNGNKSSSHQAHSTQRTGYTAKKVVTGHRTSPKLLRFGNKMMAKVRWYYRPEDTEDGRRLFHGEKGSVMR